MKKIALISSFCDNENKIEVLKKNIKKIKKLNIDVLVISPIVLPKEVEDLCDYYFLTKDNPVLDWPERATSFWRSFTTDNTTITITTTVPDYGFAGINQIKQSGEIGIFLGYGHFYVMIYDLLFDDNVIHTFENENEFLTFPSKRDSTVWDVGLHLISINRENLKKLISFISVENYLKIPNVDAFVWIQSLKNIFNYEVSQNPVEDEIYHFESKDHFNYSKIEDVKFYVEKNDENDENIKLLFYDLKKSQQVKVIVGDKTIEFLAENLKIVDLGFKKNNIKETKLIVDSNLQELTDVIKKIKHNVMKVTNN